MEKVQVVRYSEEFYPSGFRKTLAIMLVVGVTVLPEVFSWIGEPPEPPAAVRVPAGRFRPQGGFLPHREEPRSDLLQTIWSIAKRSFLVVIATLGVVLYYPRAGFKRYALLCGPMIGLLVPWCLSLYLQGRTEVYRAEILIVLLVALFPCVALYIFLTWRKAKRLGMAW